MAIRLSKQRKLYPIFPTKQMKQKMRERGGKITLVPDTEGTLDRARRGGASGVCAAGDEGGVIGK